MPVYQYHCRDCDRDFERVETMREHEESRGRCPHCRSEAIEQRMSTFFAKTAKKS